MTINNTYDSLTQFDATNDVFVCGHCGTPMAYAQGVFADPDSPEAAFAPVIRCTNPRCGHAIDLYLPAYILSTTSIYDLMYSARQAAVCAVIAAVNIVEGFGQAFDQWEAEQARSARRAKAIARREARIAALSVEPPAPVVSVKRSVWDRLFGR